jgi:hypothetical protein
MKTKAYTFYCYNMHKEYLEVFMSALMQAVYGLGEIQPPCYHHMISDEHLMKER